MGNKTLFGIMFWLDRLRITPKVVNLLRHWKQKKGELKFKIIIHKHTRFLHVTKIYVFFMEYFIFVMIRFFFNRGAGEQCSLTESFPNNYKTECRQHYVYRQLLSLSPQGRIVKEQFRFPASCKCVVKVPEM